VSFLPALGVHALAGHVPVDLGRDEAARAARAELSKVIYTSRQTPLWQRVVGWVVDRLERALSVVGGTGLGVLSVLVILALAVGLLLVVLRWTGPLRGSAAVGQPLFTGRQQSAEDHRRAADDHAAAGRWRECVIERFRAVIRGLEERGLLDERPGRTAAEAARDAAVTLPSSAAELAAGAHLFDEIAYGTLAARPEHSAELASLDDRLRQARAVSLAAAGGPAPGAPFGSSGSFGGPG
jgi:hypothetical protein